MSTSVFIRFDGNIEAFIVGGEEIEGLRLNLTDVTYFHPGVVGLSYTTINHPTLGCAVQHMVQMVDGHLCPPHNGWGARVYDPIYRSSEAKPKEAAKSKRKHDGSSSSSGKKFKLDRDGFCQFVLDHRELGAYMSDPNYNAWISSGGTRVFTKDDDRRYRRRDQERGAGKHPRY